jgi:hypothetical protein
MMLRITPMTVAKEPVTGESTKETVKTIRAGKAGCSGCTCGSAACFFAARGPWVSADTRPSLRPLSFDQGDLFEKLG